MKNTKNVWEVLRWYDAATRKFDYRVRSDVDTHSQKGFERVGENQVKHTLVGTDFHRTFTVINVFHNKREANQYAEAMRLIEKMHGGTHSIMRQEFLKINSGE